MLEKKSGKYSKESYEALENKIKYLLQEKEVMNTKFKSSISLLETLLIYYKASLVAMSALNPNYPCSHCSYRLSATQCKKPECENYSEWKWNYLP
jgi:hypothetical protein